MVSTSENSGSRTTTTTTTTGPPLFFKISKLCLCEERGSGKHKNLH